MYNNNEFTGRAQMGPEMLGVFTAVMHFGCITIEQAKLFMPETKADREKKFISVVNKLVFDGKIRKDDMFLYSMTQKDADPAVIDAVWVFLEIINKLGNEVNGSKREALEAAIENSLVGSSYEIINFILNGQKDLHIVPLYCEKDLTNAVFLDNKYFANGHSYDTSDARSLYMFAFRDIELFNKFKSLGLKLPLGIAYISGEPYKKPEIQLKIATQK